MGVNIDIATWPKNQLEALISSSFQHWTGESYDPAELYHHKHPILAHNGGLDPLFIYANHSAQALWQMDWETFVGTPSKRSAEPQERTARNALLKTAKDAGIIHDYVGIRIAADGTRFEVSNVSLWNLVHQGITVGQAAIIRNWHTL